MKASGNDITFEGNRSPTTTLTSTTRHWEAAGSNVPHTTNLVVRGNYVHHNHGPGFGPTRTISTLSM